MELQRIRCITMHEERCRAKSHVCIMQRKTVLSTRSSHVRVFLKPFSVCILGRFSIHKDR